MKTIREADIHKGHRERMRQKFAEHGASIFDTYELLEMLLYSVIPAKDTNPLAKQLLAAFGSLSGVLSASREQLFSVSGIGPKAADLIISVGQLSKLYTLDVELPEMRFDDYKKTGEYFSEYFRGCGKYQIAVMMLDNSMKLIGVKTLYDGIDYHSAVVKCGAFVELALRHGASVLIIAHNHPYGPLYPTEGDIKTNNSVSLALSDVGVLLADHYVVCGEKYLGFMASFKNRFSQQPELSRFYQTKEECVSGGTDIL